MAIVTLPSSPIKWRDAEMRLLRADGVQEFVSGATQITAFPKAIWAMTLSLPPLDPAELAAWRAALAQLSSLGNTFLAGPPGYNGPSTGYSGPAPSVAGAGQLGRSLSLQGMTANASVLAAGDFFHVIANGVRELKVTTTPLVANGSGAGVVSFEPALRNAPNNLAAVQIAAPQAEFRLASPEFRYGMGVNKFAAIRLEAAEAFAP